MSASQLSPSVWEALVARGERRVYRAGAALFLEGDPPGPVIAVLDGELRVEATRNPAIVGIDTFGPGSVIGEIAALDGLARSASVLAICPTEVSAIDGVAFNELLIEHSELALWVLQQMAARLRATTAARLNGTPSDLEARIAGLLVELTRTRGVPIGALTMIDVHHGELAGMVGADPEDTSRALAKLHTNGWVLPGQNCLHVVNVHALESISS